MNNTMIVKAPGHLIEDALKQAPPAYTLAARAPAQDLPLDGKLGRRDGRVAAHATLAHARPPILPGQDAGFGMVPVEVLERDLSELLHRLVHLD